MQALGVRVMIMRWSVWVWESQLMPNGILYCLVYLQEEAQQLGLVNRIVARSELMQEALATASLLASYDSFHMEMIKLTCNQAQEDDNSKTVHQIGFLFLPELPCSWLCHSENLSEEYCLEQ